MSSLIEDYAIIGDTETVALVARNGSIDWFCVPRFDGGACFAALLGGREHGRWLLHPTAEVERIDRRYVGDTMVLETLFHTSTGSAAVIDFMPIRDEDADRGPHRRGSQRHGRADDGADRALRLRLCGSVGEGVRQRHRGARRMRCAATVHARAAQGPRPRHVQRVRGAAKENGCRSCSPGSNRTSPSRSPRPVRRARGTEAMVDRLGVALHLRGRPQGHRAALVAHVEGAHLRADGRGGRGRHHVAARMARRRPQLGLPVLLAARRDLHAHGAERGRLRRRGRGLERLAPAGGSRQPEEDADHVRRRWRAAAAGDGARLAARLRELGARAHRQRRESSSSSSTSTAR